MLSTGTSISDPRRTVLRTGGPLVLGTRLFEFNRSVVINLQNNTSTHFHAHKQRTTPAVQQH